jgi:hypothetical protein
VILEHALLPVRPDRQAESTYLLLVEWDSLADPTVAIAQLAARVVPLEREACAALAGSRTATSAVTP